MICASARGRGVAVRAFIRAPHVRDRTKVLYVTFARKGCVVHGSTLIDFVQTQPPMGKQFEIVANAW
jgi:hypothetical protein|tara:strand:+ start:1343 stop:1543 length:201 start_codon:yes stop_codon:yes gene_type:complete